MRYHIIFQDVINIIYITFPLFCCITFFLTLQKKSIKVCIILYCNKYYSVKKIIGAIYESKVLTLCNLQYISTVFFPCLENLWLKIFFTNYVIVPSLGQSLLLYYTSYLGICGCCWWFISRRNNKSFFDFFDCSTFPTVIFLQLKFCSFYLCSISTYDISNLFNFIYFLCLQLIQHMILECQNNIIFVRPEICRFLLPFYLQSSKHYRHLNSFVPFI